MPTAFTKCKNTQGKRAVVVKEFKKIHNFYYASLYGNIQNSDDG